MLLNQAAGRIGKTVDFSQTHALGSTVPAAQLAETLANLGPGDLVFFHATNPAYSLPEIRKYLGRAGRIIYLGTMMNETAAMADWFLPVCSPLEAWGDYEPWSGVHCSCSRRWVHSTMCGTAGDILLSLASMFGHPLEAAGQQVATFQDWLGLRWRQLHQQIAPRSEFDVFWRQALASGGSVRTEPERQSAAEPSGLRLAEPAMPSSAGTGPPKGCNCGSGRRFCSSTADLANRGWLQEVPRRMSTLAWQSWVDMSPATAARTGRLPRGTSSKSLPKPGRVQAPVRVTDEIADNAVALAFGQGHTALGELADGRGANAFELLVPDAGESLFGAVELRKTGETAPLITLSADAVTVWAGHRPVDDAGRSFAR